MRQFTGDGKIDYTWWMDWKDKLIGIGFWVFILLGATSCVANKFIDSARISALEENCVQHTGEKK